MQVLTALGIDFAAQRLERYAAAIGKGSCGAGGRASGVEAGTQRRPATLDELIGRFRGEPADMDREPARCGKRFHRRDDQSGLCQARGEALGQGQFQCTQSLGRQFLGAQLDQQIAALDARARHGRSHARA
jgi:hypothetical protein